MQGTGWTLADITAGHALKRPDRVALVQGERSWTYGDLDREANKVAAALKEAGIQPQERVAYLGKNESELFAYLFAAAKINAVLVIINWRLAPGEVSHVLRDSGAKVLMVAQDFEETLPLVELAEVELTVVLGATDVHQDYGSWVAGMPTEHPPSTARTHETCVQLYTSGTTGLPKGVEITHANLLQYLQTAVVDYEFQPDGTSLVAMPMFHIGGTAWALIGLFNANVNVVMREFVVEELLGLVEQHRITHAVLVPAMLQFMTQTPGAADTDFSSFHIIVYGASPISEQVLLDSMQLIGCRFCQGYGLTETAGGITILRPDDHDPGGPRSHLLRSAGEPWGDVELRIVDTDSGAELPEGEVGEIWCRSAQTMKGYWANEPATRAVFREGRDSDGLGWFSTGDAGSFEHGYLFIRDRVKDMIVSGAENIYPAEVENILMSHPELSDAAVIGVPDPRWGETVKALVTPAPGATPEPSELIAFCKERLATYKCPTSVDFIEELPRNPSGKILKTELRKPYWEGHDRMVN